jgi:hypothetical protein
MTPITIKEFLLRQPTFPETTETDSFYLELANRLLRDMSSHSFATEMPEGLLKRVALTLTDYMQDIVSDAGLWRSFVDANRELYGWSVPFHEVPENYIDYELNREDVRFLVWYTVAMLWEEQRFIFPHDAGLLDFADGCFAILEEVYDDAPVPEEFNISRGLEFNDPDDHKAIYRLGNWLFLHSYLLTPAYSMSMREMMEGVDMNDPDAPAKMNERLDQAMMEDTTGPLALFTPEWVYLMVEGKLPSEKAPAGEPAVHPYYDKFTRFTGGEEIRFFDSYEAMNRFFIEALGWEQGEEHLAQAKGAHDYILFVTRNKGMLMARDIARCVKAPGNPLYDAGYAADHAFELLSERGCCPGDLLRYIFAHDWLPDAVFPGTTDRLLVHMNRDFIARCYLQIYYRGD